MGGLLFAHIGYQGNIDPGLILACIAVGTAASLLVFERISPAHLSWNDNHGDVGTDSLHAGISQIILPKFIEVSLHATILSWSVILSASLGIELWPTEWPIFLQLCFAMVVSQFGEYWWHRMGHQVPFLWRFHSIHHSSERLYWLNAGRFHPIDTAVSVLISITSLGILGADGEILLLASSWIVVHGLFQHCNVRLRLGPLNYIFSMAELHRWHHSLDLNEANNNYGNNIILWDLVFGTFYHPADREADAKIGIDAEAFPQRYFGQLMVPFRWRW